MIQKNEQPPVAGAALSLSTQFNYSEYFAKVFSSPIESQVGEEKTCVQTFLSNSKHSDQTAKHKSLVKQKAKSAQLASGRSSKVSTVSPLGQAPLTGRRLSAGSGSLPARPIKFTEATRRKLLYGGKALNRLGPNSVLMITATLAGSDHSAILAFEKYSSYFAKRLMQWIRNQFPQGEKRLYLWCFERQQRGALHMHLALYVPPHLRSKFTYETFHAQIRKIQIDISRLSGVDLFLSGTSSKIQDPAAPRVDAQWLRSPNAYFSKRRTKDSLELPDGTISSPTRWGNCSQDLKAFIKSLTCERYIAVRSDREGRKALTEAQESINHIVQLKARKKQKFRRLEYKYAPGSFGRHCQIPDNCVTAAAAALRQQACSLLDEVWHSRIWGSEANYDQVHKQARRKVVLIVRLDGYVQLKYHVRPLTVIEKNESWEKPRLQRSRRKWTGAKP